MPTTSPDVSTSSTGSASSSLVDERRERIDDAHRSLQAGEAMGEEAIATMVDAWSGFVRAFLPGVLTDPVRALDLAFELLQQSINLQRRLLRELMGTVQTAMAEAASDHAITEDRDGSRASRTAGRSGSTRAAA